MSLSDSLSARSDALAEMLRARLGLRGRGLAAKLARAGRDIPRPIRLAGQKIAQAQIWAAHPKLMRQIDHNGLDAAFDLIERYVRGVNPKARRRARIANAITRAAFNVVVIAGLVLVTARLRGLI